MKMLRLQKHGKMKQNSIAYKTKAKILIFKGVKESASATVEDYKETIFSMAVSPSQPKPKKIGDFSSILALLSFEDVLRKSLTIDVIT